MICNSILDAVGNTPLIKLQRVVPEGSADVLVKFEGLNVGGSVKTRTALSMIDQAEKDGLIGPDSIIVEPTSGNQGIGLALIGAVRGYRTVIIMPDSVSEERRKLVEDMKKKDPNVFIPQQFENPANVKAQYEGTAREILEDAGGPVDGFVSGIGTGGTITGIGRALKEANPDTVVWAAEPEHAAILSGGSIGTHVQMGIGDGLIPAILDTEIYDGITIITDEEALTMSKLLSSKEGILCGISSGTNVAGALKLAAKLGPGKKVVTVLPDTAERYFSTPLFS